MVKRQTDGQTDKVTYRSDPCRSLKITVRNFPYTALNNVIR